MIYIIKNYASKLTFVLIAVFYYVEICGTIF